MRVVVTSYSDGGVHNRYYESKEAAIQAVEEFVSSPPITWGPILYRAWIAPHYGGGMIIIKEATRPGTDDPGVNHG